MRKKSNARDLTAQEFINAEAIEQKILWTKDKYLFAFIQVRGRDNSLLDDTDNENVTAQFTRAFSREKQPFQLLSIPRTVDTQGMIRSLQEMQLDTDNDSRLRLLGGEIAALKKLADEGAKEPLLLLKIWVRAVPGADKALMERAANLCRNLADNQISASILDDKQILHLCTFYAELGIWQVNDAAATDIPLLPGRHRTVSQASSEDTLLEQITPVGGLFFQGNQFMVGSAYCRCYGVTRYPATLDYNWASKLMNATNAVTCLTYYPGRAGEIGDALSRSIRESAREANEETDARTRKKYERKAKDADKLIDDLDADGKALGHISAVVMPFAQTQEGLEDASESVTALWSDKVMKLRLLSCVQREAFCHLSPYYPNQPMIDGMLQRIIPLETLMGGYPMTMSLIRDDHGTYFAKTLDGGILSVDIMQRGADRTNGSGIVCGPPGIGKSTVLKHLLQSMFMRGVPCIVIDPEREFRPICKSLDGSWWDAGGGLAKVNLLEPLDCAPDDEEDAAYRGNVSPLALHIQQIQDIFRYKIPSLTDIQISLLKRTLLKLYNDWKISLTMDEIQIRSLPHTAWPIMEDLYKLLRQEQTEDPRYEEIATLIEDMAIGADALIWNGHTNIDLSNPLVVIDTNQLYNSSEENKRAQYFNLLRLAGSKVTADRTSPCFVVADESQTMVNPEMPQAARSLLNASLRWRKYEGYLWLGLHSVHEFLDDKIRYYGQPILDAPTYKILFGTDGKNLADTVDLYHLNTAERKVLESRQRGKALCLIGSQHILVDFELPEYKLQLMGKGGGR